MKKILSGILFCLIILLFNQQTALAQDVYGDDFITMVKCRDFTCFQYMMKQVKFSYVDAYSTKGVNETYQCDVPNEDGSRDLINFEIIRDSPPAFNEVIFATDRYHTYDALKTSLEFNAFRPDSSGIGENGATFTYYTSPMYQGMFMTTQVFNQSPEGALMQYYINLQLIRRE
jgi:hypothetical protein